MLQAEAGLPKLTLGWELEAIARARRVVPGIETTHDGSVGGEQLEYRVKRELVYAPDKSVAALRSLATDPALKVDRSCGFHVHIGLGKRTRRLHEWAAWFVTLGREVEEEAFAAVPATRRGNQYCRSWHRADASPSIIAQQYSASKGANRDRYCWINPVEIFRPGGIRTIEVRLMGDTKRFTYLLAWISVCRLMGMSAWALVFDPSRLNVEKNEIKKALTLVKDNFLRSDVPTATVAKTTLYLASKTSLLSPFGTPLAKITATEKDLAYNMAMAEAEHKEYTQLMASLRESIEEYRTRLIATRTVPIGAIIPGDTVEYVQSGDVEFMTQGNYYRVISADDSVVGILNDLGQSWTVSVSRVRLIERMGRETCAV